MTALNLEAISAEFLNECGPCDFAIGSACTCSDRDFRPTMLALVREVERLRASMFGTADALNECVDVVADLDEYRTAMLSARDALRTAVNR